MAYVPSQYDRLVSCYMADSSAASSAFTSAPWAGKIVYAYCVIYNAVTTANSIVTLKINGTSVTSGAITITQSGSAAGSVYVATPTALNTIAAGDKIEFASDGGATVTAPTMCVAVIR